MDTSQLTEQMEAPPPVQEGTTYEGGTTSEEGVAAGVNNGKSYTDEDL